MGKEGIKGELQRGCIFFKMPSSFNNDRINFTTVFQIKIPDTAKKKKTFL